jgi:hypothetical protein
MLTPGSGIGSDEICSNADMNVGQTRWLTQAPERKVVNLTTRRLCGQRQKDTRNSFHSDHHVAYSALGTAEAPFAPS